MNLLDLLNCQIQGDRHRPESDIPHNLGEEG